MSVKHWRCGPAYGAAALITVLLSTAQAQSVPVLPAPVIPAPVIPAPAPLQTQGQTQDQAQGNPICDLPDEALDITVAGEKRGLRFVRRLPATDTHGTELWIASETFKAGEEGYSQRRVICDGQNYSTLFADVPIQYDAGAQVLNIQANLQRLPSRTVTVGSADGDLNTRAFFGQLPYQFSVSGNGLQASRLRTALDVAPSLQAGPLDAQVRFGVSRAAGNLNVAAPSGQVRYSVNARNATPANTTPANTSTFSVSLLLNDTATTGAGQLSGVRAEWSRGVDFVLPPLTLRLPLEAEVSVLVQSETVYSDRAGPGTLLLSGIALPGASGQVQIVIRDALGRRTLSQPYQNLNGTVPVGSLRLQAEAGLWKRSPGAPTPMLGLGAQYGIATGLSVSSRLYGNSDLSQWGASGTLKWLQDHRSAALLMGVRQEAQLPLQAEWQGAVTQTTGPWHYGLSSTGRVALNSGRPAQNSGGTSPDYALDYHFSTDTPDHPSTADGAVTTAPTVAPTDAPIYVLSSSPGSPLIKGNLGLSQGRLSVDGEVGYQMGVGVLAGVGASLQLSAGVRLSGAAGVTGGNTRARVQVVWTPMIGTALAVAQGLAQGQNSTQLNVSSQVTDRLKLDGSASNRLAYAAAQYDGPVRVQASGSTQGDWNVGVSGTLAATGGQVYSTAATSGQQSAAVLLQTGQPNLPVLREGKVAGQTNAAGELLLTNLSVGVIYTLGVDINTLPIELAARSSTISVRPRLAGVTTLNWRSNFVRSRWVQFAWSSNGPASDIAAGALLTVNGQDLLLDDQGMALLPPTLLGTRGLLSLDERRCAVTLIDAAVVVCSP